ncbi:hypothetical protein GCM10023175_38030 [Pseudonocardia xishanensis]|uniref:Uncharacterized protein n=1 Tax=Pseudonocardia xishanensis TaxID=630995 RepID=A0ABP8RUB3_9PSEU
MELALSVGRGLNCCLARGEQDLQRCSVCPCARLGEMGAGQRISSRPHRVDRVGLRPRPPGRTGRGGAVELNHEFARPAEMLRQPGAITARALHRPRPHLAVSGGRLEQFGVSVGVRARRRLGENRPGVRGDDGGGVGVLMSVDADDDLDEFCEHGQRVLLRPDGRKLPSGSGDSA